MVHMRQFAILFLAVLLAACNLPVKSPTGTPAVETAEFSPIPPVQATPTTAVSASTQAVSTNAIRTTPAGTPAGFQLLDAFPLVKGTSWTYTKIGYAQDPKDPKKKIRGTAQIQESVADTLSKPPYLIVHILGNKTMQKADPGWQESGVFGLGNYEYWYVVMGDQVFSSTTRPNPDAIDTGQMSLEFQFPLVKGAQWCPSPNGKGFLTPPAATPVPCAYAGMRLVNDEAPVQTEAGNFNNCFRIDEQISSGGVTRWFCNGVGIVAEKYDHAGSQFGFTQKLDQFTKGTGP